MMMAGGSAQAKCDGARGSAARPRAPWKGRERVSQRWEGETGGEREEGERNLFILHLKVRQ